MYVIDMKEKKVARMPQPALASFLNTVMVHEIGEFRFAPTKREAGEIMFWHLMGKSKSYSEGIKKHSHWIGEKNVKSK